MNIPQILQDIGFGRRPLTFSDFEYVCTQLNITVLYLHNIFGGIAIPRRRNRQIIVLDPKGSPLDLSLRAWHEFAHLMCGHEGVRLFVRGSLERAEVEADALALCALIPTDWVEAENPYFADQLLDEGFTWQQIWERKEIYERCKI
jgi:hypothetical protein